MDWLIWVIVIVLVVAIVWWLTSRNNARNSPSTTNESQYGTPGQPGTAPPAATEPSDVSSMPETAAAAAGVAGIAGVTNMGKAAAAGSGPVEDTAAPEPDTASGQSIPNEPVVQTPSLEEPVVEEPVVDTNATVEPAGAGDVDDWESGVTADDVAPADDATRPTVAEKAAADNAAADKEAADKAEWESSWTDAAGTPVHHHEYTDAHSPTLPGAETAAAEDQEEPAATASGHLAAEHPYGVGSAGAAPDGSGPEGYPVKGDATTMTYHDEDAASYTEAPADVWFESAAHAEAAGFRPPRRGRP